MTTETRYIDFKTLRNAFREVKSFVEGEMDDKVDSINTKLADDLGCRGDDNFELLKKFVSKYNLDPTGFDYQKHFHTEYELFGSEAALLNLIKLPIYLILALIRILSFGKIQADQVKVKILDRKRTVYDMTVGDMVSWYLEGKYTVRGQVAYKLESTA